MLLNVLIAFFLDTLLGDPVFRAHPVRLIGSLLTFFERIFYPLRWKVIGGLFLIVSALIIVFFVTLGLNWLNRFFTLPFSINVITVLLLYFLFCNREMVREARLVFHTLQDGDLERARERVGRIVGRDTAGLDTRGIIRATVESVAENIVDGFTAPLFYFLVGGIPLAYVYKTVNTIDSRFGYRSSRYERFGKIGARLDDVLNFIPAIQGEGARIDIFRRTKTPEPQQRHLGSRFFCLPWAPSRGTFLLWRRDQTETVDWRGQFKGERARGSGDNSSSSLPLLANGLYHSFPFPRIGCPASPAASLRLALAGIIKNLLHLLFPYIFYRESGEEKRDANHCCPVESHCWGS